jgi:hypothetical protein
MIVYFFVITMPIQNPSGIKHLFVLKRTIEIPGYLPKSLRMWSMKLVAEKTLKVCRF